MNQKTIQQIVNYVNLAAKAAPEIKAFYEEAKQFFQDLFTQKLISKEQQDALMSWSDAHQEAVLAGNIPPEFQVEP